MVNRKIFLFSTFYGLILPLNTVQSNEVRTEHAKMIQIHAQFPDWRALSERHRANFSNRQQTWCVCVCACNASAKARANVQHIVFASVDFLPSIIVYHVVMHAMCCFNMVFGCYQGEMLVFQWAFVSVCVDVGRTTS